MIRKFIVSRPYDEIVVYLMPIKSSSGKFKFVNMSKGHICPCTFKNEIEAIEDIERCISDGSVLSYFEIGGIYTKEKF